ncbi:polyprenyl synthetase family protein [Rhodoplanes sp. TEM]|uniref:Polyprenyl synthetase family protein n=1 Tax=Rhodoplanes tepidamans TaxID=200616 RepID=A0ABT5J4R5_RHOTP|nr:MULTISPECIES: polyprenyl synthetase family protein [Rhodoplanes]MDC7784617.1 polyprenyl synthetase family protein [Rhodoplanes tepidamans]MDC7982909.1 polyprenyl synthetase family protein [Rhodoplanes sp. TEM]MDQ0355845.1 geranylgeranyl diphosphate synthase type II [Rhodoplanes tepidamans]
MDSSTRIEQALNAALARAETPSAPSKLASAMRYAVFPKGARVRPRLCLAAAAACGDDQPGLTDAAAASIELLHCASLIHDDLPCFDDAALRRGKPSVHMAYGERIAVLAGDALIVLAFEQLAYVPCSPERLPNVMRIVGQSVGMPGGIAAGQAWECEPFCDLVEYHEQKTGALFSAATMLGAAAAGHDPEPWKVVGARLGLAYQVADDLRDAAADEEELGKPIGRDAALGRPSAVRDLGIDGAMHRLESLVKEAIAAIPPCPGAGDLRTLILSEAKRLVPKRLAAAAA